MNYHNIDCCEQTRGIDILLNHYENNRDYVVSLMKTNPKLLIDIIWTRTGPLGIDNECQCQMGNGDRRSPFACAQCKNLQRLIDFRMGGAEKAVQLECGQHAGKNIIVTKTEVLHPFLQWDDEATQRAKSYLQQYHSLTMCGTPSTPLSCVIGDSFTIRTLVLWLIRSQFAEVGLPHCPNLYSVFVCRNTGYSIYEMPNIGPLSELNKYYQGVFNYTTVRTIIVQLIVMLNELTKINFSHGTPSINGLLFTDEPVSYLYDGVPVQGPITVQISDLWNASASFNGVHFFPKNLQTSIHLERNIFIPEIATKTVSMAYCEENTNLDVCKPNSINMYRLTTVTMEIYSAIRHIGFPLYSGSFDLYCFMVSLMCNPTFYDTIINHENLYRLWSMMWLHDDLKSVERAIVETHKIIDNHKMTNNAMVVIDIIRGRWLRCDIIKYLWSLIKAGW
jgi:hypothetical protein